jgi:hypothetical protein
MRAPRSILEVQNRVNSYLRTIGWTSAPAFLALPMLLWHQDSDALDIRLTQASNFGSGSADVATLTSALERAATFWENALLDTKVVDIQFGWKALGAEEWATYDYIEDTIYFNSNVTNWNLRTQAYSDQFQYQAYSVTSRSFGGGIMSTGISSFAVGSGTDLYTISLHELGHALGFYAPNFGAGVGDVVINDPLPYAGSVLPAYLVNRHLRESEVPNALMSFETTSNMRHLPTHADILVVAESGGFTSVNFKNVVVGGKVSATSRALGGPPRPFVGGQRDFELDGTLLVGDNFGGSVDHSTVVVHDANLRADSAIIGYQTGVGQLEVVGAAAVVEFTEGVNIGSQKQGTVKVQAGGTLIVRTNGVTNALIVGGTNAYGELHVDGIGSKVIVVDSGVSAGWQGGRGRIIVSNGGHLAARGVQLGLPSSVQYPSVAGTLEVSSGGSVAASSIILYDGKISGSGGTIDAPGGIHVNGGRIAPGSSAGNLSINGNVLFLRGGLELETDESLNHDVLTVNGSISFGADSFIEIIYHSGMPDVIDLGTFLIGNAITFAEAVSSDNFRLLTSVESDVGQTVTLRASDDLHFDLISQFTPAPVPEPSTAILGVIGLGVIAAATRRQQRQRIS